MNRRSFLGTIGAVAASAIIATRIPRLIYSRSQRERLIELTKERQRAEFLEYVAMLEKEFWRGPIKQAPGSTYWLITKTEKRAS